MNELSLLVRTRLKEIRNKIKGIKGDSHLKLFVIASFIISFWVVVFYMFSWWFVMFKTMPFLVDRVVEFVFSLFFLSLSVMLIFSNGIIIYSSLFKERETHFLMTCPIKRKHIFFYKFVESMIYSSWAFLFLGSPVILSYGRFYGADWSYFFLSVLFFIPFILIPAALGSIITLVIARYFARSRRAILLLLSIIIAITIAYLIYKTRAVRHFHPRQTAGWMQEIMGQLQFSQAKFLPNHWMTQGIISLSHQQYGRSFFFFMLTLSNGIFLVMLTYFLASRMYFKSFSLVHSINQKRKYFVKNGRESFRTRILHQLLKRVSSRARLMVVMIIKDVKGFIRDPAQWLQFTIFFGLLLIYILNLRKLSYNLRSPIWRNFIAFLNLGAVSFTFSTFTSRFIYPSLSLEGRKFWVLGVTPLKRSTIVMSKFFFSLMMGLIVSISLILLSDYMLEMPIETIRFHILTCILMCIGLSGISVGIGSVYVDFKEDNAAKIVSSFGGTLNLIVSILYVTLVISSEVMIYHNLWTYHYAVGLSVAAAITIAFCFIPLLLGIKFFEKLEF